jgi:hypothetical protein
MLEEEVLKVKLTPGDTSAIDSMIHYENFLLMVEVYGNFRES